MRRSCFSLQAGVGEKREEEEKGSKRVGDDTGRDVRLVAL